MNFAQAVRGQLTRSGAIRAIQSQAETELGRKLSPEEATSLWCGRTSPNVLLEGIRKVKLKIIVFSKHNLFLFVLDTVFKHLLFSTDLAS